MSLAPNKIVTEAIELRTELKKQNKWDEARMSEPILRIQHLWAEEDRLVKRTNQSKQEIREHQKNCLKWLKDLVKDNKNEQK